MSKSSNNLSTISVALTLCLVCSVLVSGVAVGLKPMQDANAKLDMNKNILLAAGEATADISASEVDAKFKDFSVKLVNLKDGSFMTAEQIEKAGISIESYSTAAASGNAEQSDTPTNDLAGIGRVPKYSKVYVKAGADGAVESIVLPVYGAGLWGKIYGFITLEGDANTIKGISFYSHKETPGLGALITEDKFRGQFPGKVAYNDAGKVVVAVTKAGLAKEGEIDGISGATLTSKGVNNFVQFWLSDEGYKPFLENLKAGKAGEV